MSKKISIITICYNNPEELKLTCQLADRQTVLPFEHWIIDGSTAPDIKNYLETTAQPAYRKWICERDNGIADAFNKGVLRSTGEICNMLNAADYYFDDTVLKMVSEAFEAHSEISWLHGKYQLQRGGQWVVIGKPFEKEKLYRGMRSLSHQSMFIKRELHDRYGLYDTTLRNAMDYDFVCRIAAEPVLFIEKPLVVFAPGGTTDTNYLKAMDEGKKVYRKHFGNSLKLILWQWRLKLLYALISSPVGSSLYKIKVWLRLENM